MSKIDELNHEIDELNHKMIQSVGQLEQMHKEMITLYKNVKELQQQQVDGGRI